jgi:hypothetical protein
MQICSFILELNFYAYTPEPNSTRRLEANKAFLAPVWCAAQYIFDPALATLHATELRCTTRKKAGAV